MKRLIIGVCGVMSLCYQAQAHELDQYIDSCVANQHPICLRMKRQIQGGQPSYMVWDFYEKETGSPACQLVYNGQTYTPPTEDARVYELHPDDNYNATFLWVCNCESPDRQEFFVRFNTPLGVEEKSNYKEIRFLKSTPNPFFSTARISYNLITEDAGKLVILSVYDIAGDCVKKLVNTKEDIGYHEIIWDGKDANSKQATPGCYFYVLKVGEHTLTKKTLLIR
ncbi:MAG: T9SS type A sorting domain-containing protein [Candidatus Stahlbacteria bacterium]|nr:T9SS type A sorting domain-containing protein [Candidatus Stahlbacteria bacterium]